MADTPRLTVRCEYPDTDLPPTEVTFRLSPSYGLTTAHSMRFMLSVSLGRVRFVIPGVSTPRDSPSLPRKQLALLLFGQPDVGNVCTVL